MSIKEYILAAKQYILSADSDPDMDIKDLIMMFRARALYFKVTAYVVLVVGFLIIYIGLKTISITEDNAVKEASTENENMRRKQLQVSEELNDKLKNEDKGSSRSNDLEEYIVQLKSLTNTQTSRNSVNSILISTTAARIGQILIILFLVQILLTTYRYNIRLSVFYKAIGDSLIISKGLNYSEFNVLVGSLDPSRLDFGKSPGSPMQQIVELGNMITRKNK